MESTPHPLGATFADRDHRAEIVEPLYDVAVDPIRLEELLEVWEGRADPLRVGPVESAIPLEDPEIEAHQARATVFLDRFEASQTLPGARSVLEDIPRSAAFLSDGGAVLAGCNRAARVAFSVVEGGAFADLPFDAEDRALLSGMIRRVAARKAEQVMTLRIRSTVTGRPVILRVSPVEGGASPPLALVVSTELVWPEGFQTTVQEAFGLTTAEVEIVRGVTLGLPLRDIAEARGRSLETVRTQVRSVLAKTETHSQSELVRVVLGLMDVALIPVQGGYGAAGPQHAGAAALARVADTGRAAADLDRVWRSAGRAGPLLDFGLIRWPATAERAAASRGMRVIVPVRAGYGRTDTLAKGEDHLAGVTRNYAVVLDHLGVNGAVAIPLGADLRFAMNLSILRPDLVQAIVGAACQLPLRSAAQYDRMDKWQRFPANARYAPRVLPFLVQAGFSLARRLGKEAFFRQVNGGSAAGMETFDRPEVRAAVLEGSDICMAATWSAHAAFAAECIGSEKDWSAVVRGGGRCGMKVRGLPLQGVQDPQSPVAPLRFSGAV